MFGYDSCNDADRQSGAIIEPAGLVCGSQDGRVRDQLVEEAEKIFLFESAVTR
jgi:hypothetical protein